MNNKELALALRKAMAESGMSRREIAEKSGVGLSTVDAWLNARHGAQTEPLGLLLATIGCKLEVVRI